MLTHNTKIIMFQTRGFTSMCALRAKRERNEINNEKISYSITNYNYAISWVIYNVWMWKR